MGGLKLLFLLGALLTIICKSDKIVASGEEAGTEEETSVRRETEERRESDFFNKLDANSDGQWTVAEINNFVAGIGGSALDTPEEVALGVDSALSKMDSGKDLAISRQELHVYWLQLLGSLSTAELVADWLINAVQLPQYVEAFRQNHINALDFPLLLENDCAVLRDDLGVSSRLHHRKLCQAIKMRLLGVGRGPFAPFDLKCMGGKVCDQLTVHWTPVDTAVQLAPAPHMYRLRMRSDEDPDMQWSVVNEGAAPFAVLSGLNPELRYSFVVSAWNQFAQSNLSDVLENCRVSCGGEALRTSDVPALPPAAADVESPSPSPSPSFSETVSSISAIIVNVTGAVLTVATLYTAYTHLKRRRRGVGSLMRSTNSHRSMSISQQPRNTSEAVVADDTPTYVPEDASLKCAYCPTTFKFWKAGRRKHICRVCSKLFCRNHGIAKCTLVCSVGGSCVCHKCALPPPHRQSLSEAPANDIRRSFDTQQGSSPFVRQSSFDLHSFKNSGDALISSLKRSFTPPVAKLGLRRRSSAEPAVGQQKLSEANAFLQIPVLVWKKRQSEKNFNRREVWITEGTTELGAFIHWKRSHGPFKSKGKREQLREFTLEKGMPLVLPKKGDVEAMAKTCCQFIHTDPKKSMDIQFPTEESRDQWTDAVTTVLNSVRSAVSAYD